MTSMNKITSNTKYLGDPSQTDWVMDGQAVAYGNTVLLTMAPHGFYWFTLENIDR